MIKNNKGFTLVEILITIALIGLLFGLGIPGVMKIRKNMEERSNKTKINLVEQAGILWGQDNKTLLQSNTCKINDEDIPCRQIDIDALIADNYLDDSNDIKGCVYVYRKNNRVYSFYSDSECSTSGNEEEEPGVPPGVTPPESDGDDPEIKVCGADEIKKEKDTFSEYYNTDYLWDIEMYEEITNNGIDGSEGKYIKIGIKDFKEYFGDLVDMPEPKCFRCMYFYIDDDNPVGSYYDGLCYEKPEIKASDSVTSDHYHEQEFKIEINNNNFNNYGKIYWKYDNETEYKEYNEKISITIDDNNKTIKAKICEDSYQTNCSEDETYEILFESKSINDLIPTEVELLTSVSTNDYYFDSKVSTCGSTSGYDGCIKTSKNSSFTEVCVTGNDQGHEVVNPKYSFNSSPFIGENGSTIFKRSEGVYQYRGKEADTFNYVKLNDEMFRIVSIHNDSNKVIKLIKETPIDEKYFRSVKTSSGNAIYNKKYVEAFVDSSKTKHMEYVNSALLSWYNEFITQPSYNMDCLKTNFYGEIPIFVDNININDTWECENNGKYYSTKSDTFTHNASASISLLSLGEAIYAGVYPYIQDRESSSFTQGLNDVYLNSNPLVFPEKLLYMPTSSNKKGILIPYTENEICTCVGNGSDCDYTTLIGKSLRPVIGIKISDNIKVIGSGTKDNPYIFVPPASCS